MTNDKPLRRPKPGEILQLNVTGLAFGGAGVARMENGLVIFVKGGLPGDSLTAKVTRRRRDFIEAKALTIETPSKDRTEPLCPHFGGPTANLCGGCKWQNYLYKNQLDWKEQQVVDHFERIAGVKNPPVEKIIGMEAPWHYRNKMEYTFSYNSDEKLTLGLHIAGTFDRIVDVTQCLLQTQKCDEIRNTVRDFCMSHGLSPHIIRKHEGMLRNLVIRTSGNSIMVCISTYEEEFKKYSDAFIKLLTSSFPEIKSLIWYLNGSMHGMAIEGSRRVLAGDNHIIDETGGLKLKVSPESFIQTNPTQCEKLYEVLLNYAELQGGETVFDLYSGMAPIAMLMAGKAGKVIGIESNPNAVADAHENLRMNNISNVEMIRDEVEKVLSGLIEKESPDAAVLDPPRVGLHKNAVKALVTAKPKRIIYVSCNPSTLARDAVELIAAGYNLKRIQPVDMFPHTAHIECVSEFSL